MSDLLEKIEAQIKQGEQLRHVLPKYYEQFIKEQHELFMEIKKELKANDNSHR
jgi:hypothetical protein